MIEDISHLLEPFIRWSAVFAAISFLRMRDVVVPGPLLVQDRRRLGSATFDSFDLDLSLCQG